MKAYGLFLITTVIVFFLLWLSPAAFAQSSRSDVRSTWGAVKAKYNNRQRPDADQSAEVRISRLDDPDAPASTLPDEGDDDDEDEDGDRGGQLEPLNTVVYSPCSGENVRLTGFIRVKTWNTFTRGTLNYGSSSRYVKVTGVGERTGAAYKAKARYYQEIWSSSQRTTTKVRSYYAVIGSGSIPDTKWVVRVHTIDFADGRHIDKINYTPPPACE